MSCSSSSSLSWSCFDFILNLNNLFLCETYFFMEAKMDGLLPYWRWFIFFTVTPPYIHTVVFHRVVLLNFDQEIRSFFFFCRLFPFLFASLLY